MLTGLSSSSPGEEEGTSALLPFNNLQNTALSSLTPSSFYFKRK